MKKILLLLLATLFVVPSVKTNAEEPTEVCQIIVNEEGEILNAEEYQKCLEENGYGAQPSGEIWGGDTND